MTFLDIAQRLFTEGILPGVGSILSFIPNIAIAIFILTLLRECGIIKGTIARFMTGFSCSVPAILSCSSITDTRQRYITIFLIPYMSCSAKLPIYILLASVFFPAFSLPVIGSVYAFGICFAFLVFSIAKRTGLLQSTAESTKRHFSRPSLSAVLHEVASCCLGFIKKAFTVILAASILIWFLQNVDTDLRFTSNIEETLLAGIGRMIAPLFAPLGFGDWRASAALITGLSAKEAVVSTFAVIAGAAEGPALCMMLQDVFTPASAFSFMVFCLLYMPCAATLAAMKKITGKLSVSLAMMVIQTGAAWFLSFLIFQLIKVII